MLAKKDKNPRVIFEDSGITENRYICEGKIWNASTLITYCKEQKYPVFKLPLVGYERNKHRRKTGSDTIESTSDSTVSETDTTGYES